MTTTTVPGGKLALPDQPNPTINVEIEDISFVEVLMVGGQVRMIIYFKNHASVDIPPTGANVACLEACGFEVRGKHLIAGSLAGAASAPGVAQPEPPANDAPPAEAPSATKNKGGPK